MKIALAIALLVGCTTYVPMPAAQAPKQPVAVATPVAVPVVHNAAMTFATAFVPHADPTAKCAPWTGRETSIPGVDSVLCPGTTRIIYCSAPDNAAPSCSAPADWTPKPAEAAAQPGAKAATKK